MLKFKSLWDSLLALLAIILALAATYGLDYAILQLRTRASQTFDFTPMLWAPPVALLLLAVGLAVLVWWLFTRAALPRVIALMYVAVGLMAMFSVPISFTTPVNLSAFYIFSTGTISFWTMTGAVLAMAGLWRLFQRRAKADPR